MRIIRRLPTRCLEDIIINPSFGYMQLHILFDAFSSRPFQYANDVNIIKRERSKTGMDMVCIGRRPYGRK